MRALAASGMGRDPRASISRIGAPRPLSPRATTAVRHLTEALRLEAKAARDPARLTAVRIHGGVRTPHPALAHHYLFDLPEDCGRLRIAEKARPGLCRVGNRWTSVSFWRDGEHLAVAASSTFGDEVEVAEIAEDASWLLHLLRERFFTDFTRGNPDLALQMLGIGVAQVRRATLPKGMEYAAARLNEGQLDAVGLALETAFSGIWGTPGTGKTFTLGFLVEAHLRLGRTCLVVTPSNVSADAALAQICDRLEADERFRRGLVMRYPHVHAPQLQDQYGEHVDFRRVLNRIGGRLHQEREDLLLDPEGTVARGTRIVRKEDRIIEISRQLQGLPGRLLNGAQVVVTTPQRIYMRNELERLWDVVILDEAGMTSLPDAVYVASRARHCVTLMGDFRQLPTVAHATDPQVREWYRKDPFTAAGLSVDANLTRIPHNMAILTEQFRMAPGISDMVSSLFYGNLLQVHVSVRRRATLESRWGRGSLYLVDTGRLNPTTTYQPRRQRRTPVHAEAVARLIECLREDDPSSGSIAVLAPYRDHVRAIKVVLGRDSAGVSVSTVHSLQGGEADTVILDLVDCQGTGPWTYFDAPAHDLSSDGVRLLNVASSRARRRLFVVADVEFLLGRLPRASAGWAYLQYMGLEAQYIDASQELTPR